VKGGSGHCWVSYAPRFASGFFSHGLNGLGANNLLLNAPNPFNPWLKNPEAALTD
jgi:hypothetical protein